jgi:hypothetical protein
MGEGDYSKLFFTDVVNDAVGKFSQRETAPTVPPRSAKMRVAAQKRQRPFVFQNERKTNFGIGFAGVEDSTFGSSQSASGLTEGII